MSENNDSFDKIAGELESEFEPEKEFKKEIKKIEDVKNKISKNETDSFTLEDVEYMEMELKDSLKGLQSVMNTLEQEIKIGAKSTMFEVYATLSNSKINAIKELRELRKIIIDLKIKSIEKNKTPIAKNLTMNFNSISDVLEAVSKKAKKNSSINKIDAEFEIEE